MNKLGVAWTANRAFLDKMIASGEQIYVTQVPARATATFAKEIIYLSSKGVDVTNFILVMGPFGGR